MTKSQERVYNMIQKMLSADEIASVTMDQVAEKLNVKQTSDISGRFSELVRDGHLAIVGRRNGMRTYKIQRPQSSLEKALQNLSDVPSFQIYS